MKCAILIDSFMPSDAIGNSALLKLRALREAGMDARAFALACDPALAQLCDRTSPEQLREIEFVRDADVLLLEFGWYTQLARFVTHAPRSTRTAAFFHGVTPEEFAPAPLRSSFHATIEQVRSLHRVDRVFCSSHYSRRMLEANGIDAGRIDVIPLPVDLPRSAEPPRIGSAIQLLWVGRMVPSKGFRDLIEALRRIQDRALRGWRLRVVTNPRLLDKEYFDDAQRAIGAAGFGDRVEFSYDVADREAMSRIYAMADIIAIPSYHDSYCLPLLEAFCSGCAVVAYDSGAIPEIATGLATLVRRGNLAQFADRLFDAMNCAADDAMLADGHGRLARSNYRRLALERVAPLAPASFARRFVAALQELEQQPARTRLPNWHDFVRWLRFSRT
jgi:glycosyltransferase involved in cell wall biosynthesis